MLGGAAAVKSSDRVSVVTRNLFQLSYNLGLRTRGSYYRLISRQADHPGGSCLLLTTPLKWPVVVCNSLSPLLWSQNTV